MGIRIVEVVKMVSTLEKKSLSLPDEIRTFRNGKLELATVNNITFGRATLQPGWKWSNDIKPIAKTDSCQVQHTQYHISGKLKVLLDNGTELDFGPGDISYLPPGHDAWVEGNEPVVILDITGMKEFAK